MRSVGLRSLNLRGLLAHRPALNLPGRVSVGAPLRGLGRQRLLGAGVKLRRFSDDVLTQAREASRALVDDQAAADPVYREIRDHWRAFAAESTEWLGANELAYASFAWA